LGWTSWLSTLPLFLLGVARRTAASGEALDAGLPRLDGAARMGVYRITAILARRIANMQESAVAGKARQRGSEAR